MKILRLKLTNFKHFKDQTIEFKDGINALIGENNAGKTSIIQAIAAIFGMNFGGDVQNDFPTKFKEPAFTTRIELEVSLTKVEILTLKDLRKIDVEQRRRFNNDEWEIITSFLVENDIVFKFQLDIEVVSETTRVIKRGGMNFNETMFYKAINDIKQLITEDGVISTKSKLNVNFSQILLYYHNSPASFPFKPLIIYPYLSEFQKNEKYMSYSELQRKLRTEFRNKYIRAQLFHLKRTNPRAFEQFQSKMEENFGMIENVKIDLDHTMGNFKLILDSFNRDITLYGGGTQIFTQIFSIIGYEDVNTVLIDEPDAHLHASLANQFVEYLKVLSESKQIIFTTHLPNIIDNLPLDNIISLHLRDGYSTHQLIEEDLDLYDQLDQMGIIPSIFKREMLRGAEELIFVEGPTDEVLLRKFIDKYVKDNEIKQDFLKYEFFPIEKRYSTDLNKFKDFFTNFLKDKKIIYIRDKDEDSPEEIERIKNFDVFHVHVWKKRQIESYLLDLDAIAKLVFERVEAKSFEDVKEKLTEIFHNQINNQFSKLLLNYVENRLRETLSPRTEISKFPPSTNIVEIYNQIHETLFSKRALTHLSKIVKSDSNHWVDDFLENWEDIGIFKIEAKKVLSEIRKKFNLNFENKDIIDYIEDISPEILNLLKDHILIPKST